MRDKGLASWTEADEALRAMGTLDARIAQKEAALTEEVNRLRDTAEASVQQLEMERTRLERELEDFCRRHRGDFRGKRSRKLNFGTVSFRLVTRIEVPGECEEGAIARLEAEHPSCVQTQKKLVKPEVGKLAGELLDELGIKRETKDAFAAKPDRESIVLTDEEG